MDLKALRTAFPQEELIEESAFGPCLQLASGAKLLAAMEKLSSKLGADVLEDYTALDLGDNFELVLHLVSAADLTQKLTVKYRVSRQEAQAPSLVKIFGSADWYEREIFDMFGIRFSGHPDLRRILLPEEWSGYPLRKDYQDERMLKRPGA